MNAFIGLPVPMLQRLRRRLLSKNRRILKISAAVAGLFVLVVALYGRNHYIPNPFARTARVIHFPHGDQPSSPPQIWGDLSLRSKGANRAWKKYSYARGDVAIPVGVETRLEFTLFSARYGSFLTAIEPEDIQSLLVYYDALESECQATDSMLEEIGRLSGLEELDIYPALGWFEVTFGGNAKSGITDTGVGRLRGMKQLKRLHLTGFGITGKSLRTLEDLPSLESLELSGTRVLPDEAEAFRAKKPTVKLAIN